MNNPNAMKNTILLTALFLTILETMNIIQSKIEELQKIYDK